MWMSGHFRVNSPEIAWNFGDDITLVERRMIRLADFLIAAGLFRKSVSEDHPLGMLIPINSPEILIPEFEKTFSYFLWLGDWHGFYIDHPDEGFLVIDDLKNIFDQLVDLNLCKIEYPFYYWLESARRSLPTGDFGIETAKTMPRNWQSNPKIWTKLLIANHKTPHDYS